MGDFKTLYEMQLKQDIDKQLLNIATAQKGIEDSMKNFESTSQRTTAAVSSHFDTLRGKAEGFKNAFKPLREFMSNPSLESGFNLATSPIGLATVGVGLLAAGVADVTKKAIEFDHAFLPIRQLNLDKSRAEMDKLKESITEAGVEAGRTDEEMAKGFQYVKTSMGGTDEEDLGFEKRVSELSDASSSDFQENLVSMEKAMRAFHLGIKDTDAIFKINQATANTSGLSLDQINENQAGYIPAVSHWKKGTEGIMEGNELYSMFFERSKNQKKSVMATEQFFQEMEKQGTQDKMASVFGVQSRDATGSYRKMPDILQDLSSKIQKMSERDFNAKLTQVGAESGPLKDVFDIIKEDKEGENKTFADAVSRFEKAVGNVNIDKLLGNADNDIMTQWTKAKNEFNDELAELGENFLPAATLALKGFTGLIKPTGNHFGSQTDYEKWQKDNPFKLDSTFASKTDTTAHAPFDPNSFNKNFSLKGTIFDKSIPENKDTEKPKEAKENQNNLYHIMQKLEADRLRLNAPDATPKESARLRMEIPMLEREKELAEGKSKVSVRGGIDGVVGNNGIRSVVVHIGKIIGNEGVVIHNEKGEKIDINKLGEDVKNILITAIRNAELTATH